MPRLSLTLKRSHARLSANATNAAIQTSRDLRSRLWRAGMTLTPSDVESISTSLAHWEIAEYCSTAFVTLGCIGEYVAEFMKWFQKEENRKSKELLFKLATLVLIVALAAELGCLVRTNQLSGRLVGSLSDTARQAATNAATALNDSGTAMTQAGVAKDAAKTAGSVSDAAIVESRQAKENVEAVSRRAERAEGEIAKEREEADQERTARLELEKEISPRILEQGKSADPLKAFSGIRYAIVVIAGADLETRIFAGQIRVLCDAGGWTFDPSVASLSKPPSVPEEGVFIEANGPANTVFKNIPLNDDASNMAAGKLKDALTANNVTGVLVLPRGLSATMPPLPTHVVIVHVGLKPLLSPHFIERLLKEHKPDENGNSFIGNSLNPNR